MMILPLSLRERAAAKPPGEGQCAFPPCARTMALTLTLSRRERGPDNISAMDDIEIITKGKHLHLVRRGTWEFARRPNVCGIVGIVAVTDARELILVEQFRPPVNA